jgi:molecular chaperone DnaK
MESDQAGEMKSKLEALKQAAYKLAEEVYKSTASQAGGAEGGAQEAGSASEAAGSGSDGQESSETVEDADYEVVDDEDSKKP